MLKLPSGCASTGAALTRASEAKSQSARRIRGLPMIFCRPYGPRRGSDSRRRDRPNRAPADYESADDADLAQVAEHARVDLIGTRRRAECVDGGRLLSL